MMKILTQKMLGAQGLGAGCQDFVISSEAKNRLVVVPSRDFHSGSDGRATRFWRAPYGFTVSAAWKG
jgi:hypothetical protein